MNPSSIIFLTVFGYAFADRDCQSYSKIGCQCETSSSSITCQNWNDMDKVGDYVNSLAPLKMMTFNLENVFLPALPAHLFRNTPFINIRFHNVSLPFLGPPLDRSSPFSGLEKSLQEFKLTNVSYLYNWDWSFLSRLANLITFKVEESKVLRIDRTFSSISASLRIIEMVNCQIKYIEDGAFASFLSLEKILLNKNRIATFKRSYLPHPANDLTVINLSENRLTQLEDDLFDGMPELKIVSLEQNLLTAIPATIAERMSVFNGFRINGNPLKCHCDLIKLCRDQTGMDSSGLPTCTEDELEEKITFCNQQFKQLFNCL